MRADFWNGNSGLLFLDYNLGSHSLRRYGARLLHRNFSKLFLADIIEIVLPISVSFESAIARFNGFIAL